MIYLGPDLQEKMIPLFHYALRPGGYLFLGPSENVSAHKDLFRPIDKKHRIFQRKESLPRPGGPVSARRFDRTQRATALKQADTDERNLPKQLEHIILQRYRPACVTVKENGEPFISPASSAAYLEPPDRRPRHQCAEYGARQAIRIPLRSALHRAAATRTRVETQLSIQTAGLRRCSSHRRAASRIQRREPLHDRVRGSGYSGAPLDAAPIEPGAEDAIHHLESQLRTLQEYAQTTLEELETTNEELQSSNEELQSTNEELETSKEELQSFNEELETVNVELNRKVGGTRPRQ